MKPVMEKGGATLLVVDDEEEVRSHARTVLEKHGFTVLTARNSVEALLLSNHHGGPIRLLITDLSMPPYMDGASLAKALRGSRPGLRVLFLASQRPDPVISAALGEPGPQDESPATGFLSKPFTPESLVGRVREMLDDRPKPVMPAKDEEAAKPLGKDPDSRSILIMVPQGDVRSSVAGLLRDEGYTVLEVRNIGEALMVCEWHLGSIGLLLADRDVLARMPAELKDRLIQIRPGMRILAASVPGVREGPLGERVRHALEEWGLEARGGY